MKLGFSNEIFEKPSFFFSHWWSNAYRKPACFAYQKLTDCSQPGNNRLIFGARVNLVAISRDKISAWMG